MKKQIVLLLTLDVVMNPEKLADADERVKEEVQQVVDKVQHHFNRDLSNTDVTGITHIKTAFVKLDKVVDGVTAEVEDLA